MGSGAEGELKGSKKIFKTKQTKKWHRHRNRHCNLETEPAQ